jgi:excisionase family DNA binding protein
MEKLLTAKQVQEMLSVDRTTVYRMLKDGRLTGIKVGQHWRFSAGEVEDLFSGRNSQIDVDAPASKQTLPLHCVQPIQDIFAEIAEIGSVTTQEAGEPITRISNTCDFCKLILKSETGRQGCIESWGKLATNSGSTTGFFTCHAGLLYRHARIEVQGKLIAVLMAGQFIIHPSEKLELNTRIHTLAQKYNIDPNLLNQAAQSIYILDERKEQKLVNWLNRVAHVIAKISDERASLMNRLQQIAAMSVLETK